MPSTSMGVPQPPKAKPDRDDPVRIVEYLLMETRAAYLDGDFARFSKHFILPHLVGTFEGDKRIHTMAELQSLFDAMRRQFALIGVIDIERRVVAARFVDRQTIEATSISRYLLPGYKLSDEVLAMARLIKADGAWRMAESRYATEINAVTRALASAGTVLRAS